MACDIRKLVRAIDHHVVNMDTLTVHDGAARLLSYGERRSPS